MHTLSDLRILAVRLAGDTSGSVLSEYSFLTGFITAVAVLGMVLIGLHLQEYSAFVGDTLASVSSIPPILW